MTGIIIINEENLPALPKPGEFWTVKANNPALAELSHGDYVEGITPGEVVKVLDPVGLNTVDQLPRFGVTVERQDRSAEFIPAIFLDHQVQGFPRLEPKVGEFWAVKPEDQPNVRAEVVKIVRGRNVSCVAVERPDGSVRTSTAINRLSHKVEGFPKSEPQVGEFWRTDLGVVEVLEPGANGYGRAGSGFTAIRYADGYREGQPDGYLTGSLIEKVDPPARLPRPGEFWRTADGDVVKLNFVTIKDDPTAGWNAWDKDGNYATLKSSGRHLIKDLVEKVDGFDPSTQEICTAAQAWVDSIRVGLGLDPVAIQFGNSLVPGRQLVDAIAGEQYALSEVGLRGFGDSILGWADNTPGEAGVTLTGTFHKAPPLVVKFAKLHGLEKNQYARKLEGRPLF